MSGLIVEISNNIIFHGLQFIIGFIFAFFLNYLPYQEKRADYLKVICFSFIGMLLPLGIYGIIPIIGVLSVKGFRRFLMVPIIISNTIFNTLIPFTDPGFTWKTGVPRLLMAFVTAVIAGITLKKFQNRFMSEDYFRINLLNKLFAKPDSFRFGIKNFFKSLMVIIIVLIPGIIINLLFKQYGMNQIMYLMYIPQFRFLSEIFVFISIKPAFLLSFHILGQLLDGLRIFGLIFLFRFKGLRFYYLYLLLYVIGLILLSFI